MPTRWSQRRAWMVWILAAFAGWAAVFAIFTTFTDPEEKPLADQQRPLDENGLAPASGPSGDSK